MIDLNKKFDGPLFFIFMPAEQLISRTPYFLCTLTFKVVRYREDISVHSRDQIQYFWLFVELSLLYTLNPDYPNNE